MSLLATAGISALIKYGPSLIRILGESKGGTTEQVAHTIADVVEAVNGDTSPSSVAKVKATVDSLPPEVVGEIELGLAQIEAEREKARLAHDLGMHTQQQETLRSGKEIKTFRPEIARRHSWFTAAYIFVMELLNAFDHGNGANWEIALLIASPVLAWFGFRTWDKFSKQGGQLMDAADMADKASASFRRMTFMRFKPNQVTPTPPIKTDEHGAPLCVRCDADITQRRRIIVDAQRCADCQQDVENGNR